MRTGLAFAAALGFATTVVSVSDVRADDDISKQFTISATKAAGGKVDIVIKPANDKVWINSEFNIKVHVDPKDGGKVDKTDLTKDDGTYVKSTHEGKASSVTFHVTADKGVKGNARVVVCSLTACGNPTSLDFESK